MLPMILLSMKIGFDSTANELQMQSTIDDAAEEDFF